MSQKTHTNDETHLFFTAIEKEDYNEWIML